MVLDALAGYGGFKAGNKAVNKFIDKKFPKNKKKIDKMKAEVFEIRKETLRKAESKKNKNFLDKMKVRMAKRALHTWPLN